MSEAIYLKKSDQKVPRPTEKDNNKILSVVDGKPAWVPVTDFVQSSVPLKDVNFYDYDGKVVASYSLEEAQNLTSLPEAPAHKGLIFQGWNWNLDDINTLTNPMNVGAMYTTDDGKTRLYISIYDDAVSTISFYFSQTVSRGVTINWGDGTAIKTSSATGSIKMSHTYASAGDYVIELSVFNGCVMRFNNNVFEADVSKPYGKILQHVNIGKSVDSIGPSAFSRCYSLTSITIPNGVKRIDSSAFSDCYSLTSITIPNGVISIGSNAFFNCISLTSITIPNGVTSIGNSVLYNCISLTSITIPNGVKSIGVNLFYGCRSLTSIMIPNSVTSIERYAFSNCSSLTSITIPNGVISIGDNAFYICSSLTSITIPNSVPSISNNAFYNCYSLTSITIPNGVKNIYNSAFYNCYSLTSITIPNGVKSISNNAFNNCPSLTSITIPNSVTSIGSKAFYNCGGIVRYHLMGTTPPTLSATDAFTGIFSNCIIYVPKGCLEAYQTATNWSYYSSYMQEEVI